MDYKLKNRDGVETTYAKDKIKIPAATGDSMVVFTQGEAQAEKTVEITSNGTTEVTPDDGYNVIRKVKAMVNVPGVQANWAQSDSTAVDYVKNRFGGFYIPGMSAQTITFDGVETGRETIDVSAVVGVEGVKIVKVSDIGLYPINLEGCAIKRWFVDSEQQVSTFTVSYLTDYGIATLITDEKSNPIILSVVSDYNFHGIHIGVGTWFMSMVSTIPVFISSLELPDTSGKMLNVNIPAALLDLPRADSKKLGGVKADYVENITEDVGDRIIIDSDGFLRYPFKPVTVLSNLTTVQKNEARKSIDLCYGAVFGDSNEVSGRYHLVSGRGLILEDNFTTIIGQYNESASSKNKAFVVGGGSSYQDRENIFSVDWNGNVEAGKSIVLESSTEGSVKKFRITVDDTGTIKATEV